MEQIEIEGYVTDTHDVIAKVPEGFPAGKVRLIIQAAEPSTSDDDTGWTEEELNALLTFHPVPAQDLVTGGWEAKGIQDSQAWVEEVRRKAREQRRTIVRSSRSIPDADNSDDQT